MDPQFSFKKRKKSFILNRLRLAATWHTHSHIVTVQMRIVQTVKHNKIIITECRKYSPREAELNTVDNMHEAFALDQKTGKNIPNFWHIK